MKRATRLAGGMRCTSQNEPGCIVTATVEIKPVTTCVALRVQENVNEPNEASVCHRMDCPGSKHCIRQRSGFAQGCDSESKQ